MPRLFLLAVGGTGVRVTKALVNTLATGAGPAPSKGWEIVPVVLDPHAEGDDLKRTRRQLRDYNKLYDALPNRSEATDKTWFGVKLTTHDRLHAGTASDGELLAKLEALVDKTFGEFVGVNALSAERRALVHALYDQRQLDTHMSIGFVGNPGIGVVALDDLNRHGAINALAGAYNPGDRIFIVSSIFGGTGAAAFPRLLNLIRQASTQGLQNASALQGAVVGALSVQPYFRVDAGDGKIKQDEFMQRTRAALRFYQRSVGPQVDALYTLGHNSTQQIENDPGEGGQQNPAHFAELAGALSIIHFLEQGPTARKTEAEQYQYALSGDPATGGGFNLLTDGDRRELMRPFTEFYLMCRYLRTAGEEDLRKHRREDYLEKVSAAFGNSREKDTLVRFAKAWEEWIREMAGGDPAFALFNDRSAYTEAVNGIEAKPSGVFGKLFGSKTYLRDDSNFRNSLNAAGEEVREAPSDLARLLRIYERAAAKAADDTYAFPD